MSSDAEANAATREQVDAVMLGVQALVGIAATSVAEVEDRVTLPQLRVLMLLAGRGRMNLSALAKAMDVHPSNASRACDRLVGSGLIHRAASPVDRRTLIVELTDAGRDLIAVLVEHRRAAIASVLERESLTRPAAEASAMRTFGETAGEEAAGAWKLGWDG